ncbi:MAG: metallophosphoesterase [Aerococcus suis]|nr:metallophosphoesterase [Aerococcus suis]
MAKHFGYKQLVLSSLMTATLLGAYSNQAFAAEVDTQPSPIDNTEQVAEHNQVSTHSSNEDDKVSSEEKVESSTNNTAQSGTEDKVSESETSKPEEPKVGTAGTAEVGNQEVAVDYEKPEVAPVEQSNQPDRIATTMTEHSDSEMAFNWYTKDALEDASVYLSENEDLSNAQVIKATHKGTQTNYLERDKDGNVIYELPDFNESGKSVYFTDKQMSADNHDWIDGSHEDNINTRLVQETINKAIAKGLKPNTRYFYRVGAPGFLSPIGTFKTASAGAAPFTFIHYTDTQNAYWNEHVRNEAAFGAKTLAEALHKAGKDVNFALHTGDVVETSSVEDEWKDILNRAQDGFLSVPHVMVPGNHDTYETSFNDHLNVPINHSIDGGSYYSFDYNGAHMAVLNTNDNKKDADNPEGAAMSHEQLSWLENDLREARERGVNWLILSYHKPLYSSSYHSLQDEDVQAVRERLMTLIDKYDVDLVLNGHDHVLTATKPLVANMDVFADGEVDDKTEIIEGMKNGIKHIATDGTMFIIPNAAGTKLYDDIYNAPLEHIHKVRPKLSHMTQEDLDHYRTLFDRAEQPEDSKFFLNSHSNKRESSTQNFGVFEVSPDEIKFNIYQVHGNVLEMGDDELREPQLIASYSLINDQFKRDETPDESEKPSDGEANSEGTLEESTGHDDDKTTESQVDTPNHEEQVAHPDKEMTQPSEMKHSNVVTPEVVSHTDQLTTQSSANQTMTNESVADTSTRETTGELMSADMNDSHMMSQPAKESEQGLPQTGQGHLMTWLGLILSGLGFSLHRKRQSTMK